MEKKQNFKTPKEAPKPTEKKVLAKLMSLCAKGEHSSGEMRQKMRLWGVDEAAQARIMEQLVKEKFIDDERYTRAFVNDKIKYNQWGRRKIEQALWTKGIDKATQQKVLDTVDENLYLEALRPLLKSKSRSVGGRNEFERQMKLARYAMSRGFSMSQVNECLDFSADFEEF